MNLEDAGKPRGERRFLLLRLGKKWALTDPSDVVVAETCSLNENGDLVFRTRGRLVLAVASGTWSDLKEPEDD